VLPEEFSLELRPDQCRRIAELQGNPCLRRVDGYSPRFLEGIGHNTCDSKNELRSQPLLLRLPLQVLFSNSYHTKEHVPIRSRQFSRNEIVATLSFQKPLTQAEMP
jgi:hypothetical protein